MSKINLYQTTNEYIIKAFCLLSEKCYFSGTNTVVIICQEDQIPVFDKSLWSYSRKKYIPHATYLDSHNNLQPIYITNKFENPNNADSLLIINHTNKELIDLFDNISSLKHQFKRINILISHGESESAQIITQSPLINDNFQHFKQNVKGLWEDITNKL